MKIIVGGIIEKNGKVILVQEAKEKCYGKWNIPAGHLDVNESITSGAIREIKEETGCDVEITGILSIFNEVRENDIFLGMVFSTKLINEDIKYDKNEILDVKWYDIDEVLNNMDDKLRNTNFIKHAVLNLKEKKIASMEIINEILNK